MACAPAERGLGLAWVGHQHCGVARAPLRYLQRKFLPRTGHYLPDDFKDRVPVSCSEVEDGRWISAAEILESGNVREGQIRHVDVIADARPVRGRVVLAENLRRLRAPEDHVQEPRNQMGFRRMVFANGAVRIRPRGIEVTQRNEADSEGLVV